MALIDVVVVPDFSGAAAAKFELRTLFFLASWLEYAAAGEEFQVRIAAIGDPPASVQRLTARAGGLISRYERLTIAQAPTVNKLRGLEIDSPAPRILLLDADIVVMGPVEPVLELGEVIAVAPTLRPRVPARYWRHIYPALEIDPPTERMPSVFGEMLDPRRADKRSEKQNVRLLEMYPYYHSGVILVPSAAPLRPLWADYIQRIAELYTPDDPHWRDLGRSDEAGFAVAVTLLGRQGYEVTRLPDRLDASWPHLLSGALPSADVRLYHASNIFQRVEGVRVDPAGVRDAINLFCDDVLEYGLHGTHRFDAILRKDEAAYTTFVERLRQELHLLDEKYVQPVLRP